MNKRIVFLLYSFLLFFGGGVAQNIQDTLHVKLDEANVVSQSVISKKGGVMFYPSKELRLLASNSLDLLAHLQIPSLYIDQVEKSISYNRGSGRVVVLIDGVESTLNDVQALPVIRLKSVECTTSVSMKYGSNIALVIDVHTRQNTQGIALGVNAMNAITTSYNEDGAWLKYFCKRSSLGVDYNFRMNDISKAFRQKEEWVKRPEIEDYRKKTGRYEGGDYRSDALKFSYNYTLPEQRTIDVKAGVSSDRFPQRTLKEQVEMSSGAAYSMETLTQSKEQGAHVGLYYKENCGKDNTLTLSLATAYLDNTYKKGFILPGQYYTYDVEGKKGSLRAELEFLHYFKGGQILALGGQHEVSRTKNQYLGEINLPFCLLDNAQYAYLQYSGEWRRLYYSLGVGMSRHSFRQTEYKSHFLLFRPKVMLEYSLNDVWKCSYAFEQIPNRPQISDLTASSYQEDDWFGVKGNPLLKVYQTYVNTFALDFQRGNTTASLFGVYEYAHHQIGDKEFSWDNGMLWRTKDNNINFHHWELSFYLQRSFLKDHITAYVEPKFNHDITRLEGWNNANRCISLQLGGRAYYKNWSLSMYYRSPTENITGRTKTYRYASSDFSIGYKYNTLAFKIGIRNFLTSGFTSRITRQSIVAPMSELIGNRGFKNMFYLSLSWSLLKGHQNKIDKLREFAPNLDTGIIK